MKIRIMIGTLAIMGMALFGCSSDADEGTTTDKGLTSADVQTDSQVRTMIDEPGMQIVLPLEDLAAASELVVKGSPVSQTSVEKDLAVGQDYPADLKTLHAGLVQQIDKVSFRVDEYYKGTGPSEIFVMLNADSGTGSGSNSSLQEGTDYVLFLFRSDTDEGKAYWDHGYLIQGSQGLWTVSGDRASRAAGSLRDVPLTRFSKLN